MRKLIVVLVILTVMLSLVSFDALADNGKLTVEEAIKTLQSINPNIANYDIEAHLVTFKDGSKPVYVTPKGEHSRNGEVTWEYFIKQKGDLRGWLKLPKEKIIEEKMKMIREFQKRHGISFNTTSSSGTCPDSWYVSCYQFPQKCNNWCGPAATESVLSGWGIGSPTTPVPSQSEIADREGVSCGSDGGASENSIASTLNYYLQENWYGVNHWGYDPQNLWLIVYVDIGYDDSGFVSECDTVYLKDWRENVSDWENNRVHYIAVRGYWTPTDGIPVENDWKKAKIACTDSATSIYPALHAYATENFYGGITYTSIPNGYVTNRDLIKSTPPSIYNTNLRWPAIG